MDTNYDKLEQVDISREMRTSFLDYSMSVIVQRALPDVRDGMKPVHRRILHSMNTLGITTRWSTDMATSVRWTETARRPCDIQKRGCPRSPWR